MESEGSGPGGARKGPPPPGVLGEALLGRSPAAYAAATAELARLEAAVRRPELHSGVPLSRWRRVLHSSPVSITLQSRRGLGAPRGEGAGGREMNGKHVNNSR